jgi:uncharacterized protein DUF2252
MIMAHDLAATPRSGLTVQCCGDAHERDYQALTAAAESGRIATRSDL